MPVQKQSKAKRIVNNRRPSASGAGLGGLGSGGFLLEDYPPRTVSTPPLPPSSGSQYPHNTNRNNNNNNNNNEVNTLDVLGGGGIESFKNENKRLVVSEPLTNSAATRKQLQQIINELQNEGNLPASGSAMPNIRRGSGGVYRNTNPLYANNNPNMNNNNNSTTTNLFETSSRAYGKFTLKNVNTNSVSNGRRNTGDGGGDLVIPPRAHSQDTYTRASLKNIHAGASVADLINGRNVSTPVGMQMPGAAKGGANRFSLGRTNKAGNAVSPNFNAFEDDAISDTTPFISPPQRELTAQAGGDAKGSNSLRQSTNSGFSESSDVLVSAQRELDFMNNNNNNNNNGVMPFSMASPASVNNKKKNASALVPHQPPPSGVKGRELVLPPPHSTPLGAQPLTTASKAQPSSAAVNTSSSSSNNNNNNNNNSNFLVGFNNNNYDCKVLLSTGKTTQNPIKLSIGHGSLQGMRPSNEDAHFFTVIPNFIPVSGKGSEPVLAGLGTGGGTSNDTLLIAGICDGHCGRNVADLASVYLPEMFKLNRLTGENNAKSLVSSILLADRKIFRTLLRYHEKNMKGNRRSTTPQENISTLLRLGKGGGFDQSIRGGFGGTLTPEPTARIAPEPITDADLTLDKDFDAYSNAVFTANNSTAGFLNSSSNSLELLNGGSTLIMAVLYKRILYVANLGDARAVLVEINSTAPSAAGRMVVTPMSEDHKPSNAKEHNRIKYYGGFVQFNRVCGVLAVSRALGDFEFKFSNAGLSNHNSNSNSKSNSASKSARGGALPSMGGVQYFFSTEHNAFHTTNGNRPPTVTATTLTGAGGGGHIGNMVSNVADVTQVNITDSSKFLILACDGLWDVLSNSEAAQFVCDFLSYTPDVSAAAAGGGAATRPSPQVVQKVIDNCATKLAEFAIDRGSTDNVSVVLIFMQDVVDVVVSFNGNSSSGGGGVPASAGRASMSLGSSRAASPRLSTPRVSNNTNNTRTPEEILKGSYRNNTNLFSNSRRW